MARYAFAWRKGRYATSIAPAVAGVALVALFLTVLSNYNVLITGDPTAPLSPLAVVLPGIVVGAGLLGVAVGAGMRARRPAAYARIGRGRGRRHSKDRPGRHPRATGHAEGTARPRESRPSHTAGST